MLRYKKALLNEPARKVAHAVADGFRWSAMIGQVGLFAGLKTASALHRATLGLVFPDTCLSCHGEMTLGDAQSAVPLCTTCLDELEIFPGPTCRQCGATVPIFGANAEERPVAESQSRGCYRCRGRKLWFHETIAAGLYAGRLRELLLRMKRAEGDSLSLAVAELVWKLRGDRLASIGADVIVPIPLHWRRRLVHRTNSAALMAEVFARRLRRPLSERLLRRRRHTEPQFSLTPPQRWENVRQAFSVRRGYDVKQAHVLLVDDILTTGATCSEAARALRKSGAARVTVVVAARAVH